MSTGVSERASERMSAEVRKSEAGCAEQADELAVRANKRAEERMVRYFTRRFQCLSSYCETGERMAKNTVARHFHHKIAQLESVASEV